MDTETHICETCGFEAKSLSGLMAHERKHEGRTEDRKKRIPFGVARLKLTTDQSPGKKRRWINDKGDRLQRAVAGGYRFVSDPNKTEKVGEDGNGNENMGSGVSKVVGTKEGGGDQVGYLMEIDEKFYAEDQEAKHIDRMEVMKSIAGGTYEEGAGDNRYVPKEGIKLKTG